MRHQIEQVFDRITSPQAQLITVGAGILELQLLVDTALAKLERYEAVAEWAKSRGFDEKWGPAAHAQLAADLQSEDIAGDDFGRLVAKLHAVALPIEFADQVNREVPQGNAEDPCALCSDTRAEHSAAGCESCACKVFIEPQPNRADRRRDRA